VSDFLYRPAFLLLQSASVVHVIQTGSLADSLCLPLNPTTMQSACRMDTGPCTCTSVCLGRHLACIQVNCLCLVLPSYAVGLVAPADLCVLSIPPNSHLFHLVAVMVTNVDSGCTLSCFAHQHPDDMRASLAHLDARLPVPVVLSSSHS